MGVWGTVPAVPLLEGGIPWGSLGVREEPRGGGIRGARRCCDRGGHGGCREL